MSKEGESDLVNKNSQNKLLLPEAIIDIIIQILNDNSIDNLKKGDLAVLVTKSFIPKNIRPELIQALSQAALRVDDENIFNLFAIALTTLGAKDELLGQIQNFLLTNAIGLKIPRTVASL